jgi:hypothetical protein
MSDRNLLEEATEPEVPASGLIPLFAGWEELSEVMAVGELDGGPQAIEGLPDDPEAAESLVRRWLTENAVVRRSWKCLALLPQDWPDSAARSDREGDRRRIDPADPHKIPDGWDAELAVYQTCDADDPLATEVTLLAWPGWDGLEDWLANESRQGEVAGQGSFV